MYLSTGSAPKEQILLVLILYIFKINKRNSSTIIELATKQQKPKIQRIFGFLKKLAKY